MFDWARHLSRNALIAVAIAGVVVFIVALAMFFV